MRAYNPDDLLSVLAHMRAYTRSDSYRKALAQAEKVIEQQIELGNQIAKHVVMRLARIPKPVVKVRRCHKCGARHFDE